MASDSPAAGNAASPDEIVTSITWHFLVGCTGLTRAQLAEHKGRQGCPACDGKSPAKPGWTAAALPEACRG